METLVARVAAEAADPLVREIWLSSEDTGAYGRDLGASLPQLLRAMVAVLPKGEGRLQARAACPNVQASAAPPTTQMGGACCAWG